MNIDKCRFAVLIMGSIRELDFILSLFPYMSGVKNYDIYVVLRHVNNLEKSRLGNIERDFNIFPPP